jgi:DNA-binding CsgD family transcriptional regulator
MIAPEAEPEYCSPVSSPKTPRSLIRLIESEDLPVQSLQAIHELRAYLDDREAERLLRARELGASTADIAEALGITRQGVYNKLRALAKRLVPPTVVIPELQEQALEP